MSASFRTTIERDGIEFTVTVEYDYYPGCKGARDSLGGVRGAGPPLEPDDPPELEILHVWTGDKADFALDWSDHEQDQIRQECFEDVADRYQDAMEARAESRAEGRMDDHRLFVDGSLDVTETPRLPVEVLDVMNSTTKLPD